MTTESTALYHLRSYLSNPLTAADLVVIVNALCASQDGAIGQALAVCSERISEEIPDDLPADKADANNGRGEFDLQSLAIPAWQSTCGAMA